MNVWVFGRGKLGTALAAQLRAADVAASLRASSHIERVAGAGSGRVFVLAVPDAQIRLCAERLAPRVGPRDVVLHCAGSRDERELAACAARGAHTAAMHPLVSFASRRRLPPLRGATFVVSGDAKAVRAARRLCRALQARCLEAAVLGPAYHAAAALLANGAAALGDSAVRILCALGLNQRDAELACAGLLDSVAYNVRQVGVPAALTGPVARGDLETVRRHRRALAALNRDALADYARIQPIIARCAARMRAS